MTLRIDIEGAFGEANFGDDLLLHLSCELIAAALPQAKRIVRAAADSRAGDYLDRFGGVHEVRRGRRFTLPRSDARVFGGGTQFYSFPKPPGASTPRDPLLGRIARKIEKTFFLPRRRYFVGLGLGPFMAGNQAASAAVLREASFLSVRDKEALAVARGFGLPTEALGADLCFAAIDSLFAPLANRTLAVRGRVGVVLRDFPYDLPGRSYLAPCLQAAQALMDQGIEIEFFAFSALKDREAIAQVQSLGYPLHVWRGEFHEMNAYLERLAACELVLSTRYHGLVVAAALARPCVGLELDPKVGNLCSELGGGALLWQAPYNAQALVAATLTMQADIAARSAALVEARSTLARRALAMQDAFKTAIRRDLGLAD
jgi:polysaccharide pyruvyl transferase WcaK-like protein